MKFVTCNCLTKTPEPKYHKENCPVWLVDQVHKLLAKLVARDEALTILSLKLNMSGEQLEELVELCGLPLSERFKKMGIPPKTEPTR